MSIHVLLIEDDKALREILTSYMSRRGHRVTACATIADATRQILLLDMHNKLPDTVLSDIHLPDGSGMHFYVKHAPRMTGVNWILMSGYHELVRQGSHLKDPTALPRCAIIDKPVPLRLLNRYLTEGVAAAPPVPAVHALVAQPAI